MTKTITRRRFIASGSMASAGALLAPRQTAPRVHDVAVLGAGMAGLTAARRLSRAGLDVVVVEARDRVGGRMHTLKDPTAHGVEVGAQMVHGSARGHVGAPERARDRDPTALPRRIRLDGLEPGERLLQT